ncbi:hypothetical protein EHS39_33460 [Ensifer sp. MPMI2T]|nr:hypothetical protein EHS39_33460 [Ensifer sp. MPMI2T]
MFVGTALIVQMKREAGCTRIAQFWAEESALIRLAKMLFFFDAIEIWGRDVRIRLFGGLEVTTGEGRPVRFATRKAALLFAVLVLAGLRAYDLVMRAYPNL